MIPKPYQEMHESNPEYMQAYESFGQAARLAGTTFRSRSRAGKACDIGRRRSRRRLALALS